MARVFTKKELPHFHSTRDTRDRLDLIKEKFPIDGPKLHADRIIYHPGDSAAKHYHVGSYQLFVVLEGEGFILTPDGERLLRSGMVAIVPPEEIHWFENRSDRDFTFVEFWAPPPVETIWITDDV